jgi:preprotein translocase subunit Sss1
MLKAFTKVVGVVFLLVGILGFFISDLFGIIHFDLVHNLIHLVVGVWGIIAGSQLASAKLFARLLGITYLAVGALGFILPGVFGLLHLELAENLLHLVVGGLGLYLSFTAPTSISIPDSKAV